MQKRINFRFALYLTLTIAVLATGTHFLHAFQVRRNASSLRDRAHQFREQGDLEKTADCLSQYLGLNPSDVDGMAEYALLVANDELAKTPQSRFRALLSLEKVLVRDPERQDVRRRAAQVAMSIRYFASARDNLRFFCPDDHVLPKDADPEVVLMLARCFDALGDFK